MELVVLLHRKDLNRIMGQIDDLNTAVTVIQNGISTLTTEVQEVISDFQTAEAALAAGSPDVDLSGPISALTTIASNLSGLNSQLAAAIPVASSPVPPPPPAAPIIPVGA